MDVSQIYHLYLKSRLISTDSRKVLPGSVFFALKGDQFNGNQFALQALENGASAAIVDEDPVKSHPGMYRVENTLAALQDLAAYHRLQTGVVILAITGSNGKTTTKELCREILSRRFTVYATGGNLNNHIGVPLTLLAMHDGIQIGIVEMGANHPGEIRDLCRIARPDYGLITNIGKAHLEGFGSIEGVARAKGELFQHLMMHGKTIFLNEGNSYLTDLVPYDYQFVVVYNSERGLRLKSLQSSPLLELEVTDGKKSFGLTTNLLGSYNAENVLAACCVGIHLGIPLPQVKEAIREYVPRNHRSQLIDSGRNRIFMDAYNANPSSMRAAIDEFLALPGNSKMMILGEMRELGNSEHVEHDELIRYLRDKEVKQVFCVGRSFEQCLKGTGFLYFTDTFTLSAYLAEHPVSGCFILVKGSRANQLEKILPML